MILNSLKAGVKRVLLVLISSNLIMASIILFDYVYGNRLLITYAYIVMLLNFLMVAFMVVACILHPEALTSEEFQKPIREINKSRYLRYLSALTLIVVEFFCEYYVCGIVSGITVFFGYGLYAFATAKYENDLAYKKKSKALMAERYPALFG